MNNNLKWFTSPNNGKQVAVNLDENNWAWIKKPSLQELDQILREHEAKRAGHLWESFCQPHEKNSEIITAFVARAHNHAAARYVNLHQILQDRSKSQTELGEIWRSKPIAEQVALMQSVRPTTRNEYARFTSGTILHITFAHDFRAMLREHGDVDAFLSAVWNYAIGTNERGPSRGTAEQYVELISLLRAKEHLLFPLAYWRVMNRWKWEPLKGELFGGPVSSLFNTLTQYTGGRRKGIVTYQNMVLSWVSTTSLSTVADLSPELVDELEQLGMNSFLLTEYNTINSRDVRWVASVFRHAWNFAHPDKRINELMSAPPARISDDVRRSDGRFRWLATACPAMKEWVEPLALWIDSKGVNHSGGLIADLNIVLDYLRTVENPPVRPADLERRTHIHDVTFRNKQTLMQFLSTSEYVSRRRTRIMSSCRQFLNFYIDYLHDQGEHTLADSFKNPITDQDKFDHGDRRSGSTHRAAIPSWVLREMEQVLTDVDYAFPKSRHQAAITVHDYVEGKAVTRFWPGPTVALLTLLTTPIRSHQARWLDSGDFDEFVYDAATGKEVKNPNPLAIPGRRQGCIRVLHDSLRMESWTGLYVNTNKTAVYGAMGSGYEIPYVKPSLVPHLVTMRTWNQRYLHPLEEGVTVRRSDARYREEHYEDVPETVLPRVAPLFRDPTSRNQDIALSYRRLQTLYIQVLKETEERIKVKHDLDVSLTRADDKGALTYRFDLHTLRVSGISAMIDNGVPIEVVSQFIAGHHTLLMTLWYYRHSPGKLRDAIAKHHAQAEQDGDFVGGEAFAKSLDDFAPYLLSKEKASRDTGSDPAFASLKEHTGLWSINTDGICPGTSCITGGDLADDKQTYGPVPGGRRCGLCRYWITGPAFIVGQMAEANNLIYQIRKKGQELAEARDTLIEYEDTGMKSDARRIRDRIEYLERELQLDISEWTSRYSYAMASSELLEEYHEARASVAAASNLPTTLLTASSPDELRLTLSQSHEFVLIDHVTQMCNFMPGFQNREARNEKHLLLSKVLAENGMRPFLLTMDKEQANLAGDLMSALILEYVNAQDLDRVLSGEMKLSEIPNLKNKVDLIENGVAPKSLKRSPIYLRQED